MVSNTSCEQDNLSIADIFLLNLFLTVVKNIGKMDTGGKTGLTQPCMGDEHVSWSRTTSSSATFSNMV